MPWEHNWEVVDLRHMDARTCLNHIRGEEYDIQTLERSFF